MGIVAGYTDDPVSMMTLEKIDMAIRSSSLDREPLYKQMDAIKTETEAMEFLEHLNKYQGIPGLHFTPHTLDEQGMAIRYMVDKDNFYERNNTSGDS